MSTSLERLGISTLGMDGGRSGIGRYTLSVLGEMARLRPEWRVDVVGQGADQHLFGELPAAWRWISVSRRTRGALREILWTQTGLRRLARRRGWQAAFLPAGNRRLPYDLPCPAVGTVHDLSTLHVADKYDPLRRLYIVRVLPALIRRLDRAITVSRASARDLEDHAGVDDRRIDVVLNGVTPRPVAPAPEARSRVAGALGIREPWMLYISRLEHPGKNHLRLIDAYERLVDADRDVPHRLVLAGADWSGSEVVHGRIAASPLADRIVTTGFVESDLLHDLLDGAGLLVFPSLYEGFGLPVLEAMAAGVPVACSDRSSLPEVAGEAAFYFDPDDPASICSGMASALAGGEGRRRKVDVGRRRAAELTWRRAAERTVSSLERAARS
ncbi:MAG: glycosyltransferase family 1 protein [Acidobacteriota bacterium]